MVPAERLAADALSLRVLVACNQPYLEVLDRAQDLRRYVVEVRADAPVAAGDTFRIEGRHELLVEIPDGYLGRDGCGRFIKSRVRRLGDRLFHPNVWASDGYFCYDSQFTPSKSLADQLFGIVEMMQCRAVNSGSPANWDADLFYLSHGTDVRAAIRPVQLVLPRGVRMRQRPLPRIL